ncbi:hypothetical protein EQM14_15875 [Caproiciproducens sp. NJN-50]|uniref:hypothetical protein n=1 Tax=Acutalibacteraceae TaxID=3082771 RepID=UPI000FFDFDC3|nr:MULTISPECIES: hypothetical protein [Acutalibacteraceae]QAT51128.1 hypothetical protein EQM14_15875 [Caproiciproducens sp. NJN-50]
MDTKDKNQNPQSYSADYRSSYSPGNKKAPPEEKTRKTVPEPGEGQTPASKPKPEPEQRPSASMPKEEQKPQASAQRVKQSVPSPSANGKKRPSASTAARRARLENETEIDDFLPESDGIDDERLLTKWDDGLGASAPARPQPRRRGRHRYGIFVGSVVLILALVGVGFLATTIGTKIHSALTDDTGLRQYDQFLTVAVAQDPQPFSSPDKADSDFVLNASLWQCMTSDSAANYTDYDDAGRTIVPLGDVVDACRQLFGPDCQLQPKNPEEETFFEYDSQNAQFHVALYSLDSTYTPYTENAKKKDDIVVLKVGYVPPSDDTRAQSGSASSNVTPKPVKYMEYDLKTDPSTQKQYIYAVKALSE